MFHFGGDLFHLTVSNNRHNEMKFVLNIVCPNFGPLLCDPARKDLDVAMIFNAMGDACRSKGDLGQALPHYDKALYVKRRKYKDNQSGFCVGPLRHNG